MNKEIDIKRAYKLANEAQERGEDWMGAARDFVRVSNRDGYRCYMRRDKAEAEPTLRISKVEVTEEDLDVEGVENWR